MRVAAAFQKCLPRTENVPPLLFYADVNDGSHQSFTGAAAAVLAGARFLDRMTPSCVVIATSFPSREYICRAV